jgi:hypothetical protein
LKEHALGILEKTSWYLPGRTKRNHEKFVPTYIRTKNLSNTSSEIGHHTNLLGENRGTTKT